MPRPLTVAITFSVTAHAALLLSWAVQTPRFSVTPQATAPARLQVSFADTVRLPTTRPKSAPLHPAAKHPSPATPLVTAMATLPEPIDTAAPAATTSATPPAAQILDSTLRSMVLQQLQTDFRNYFYYPLLARRNGWQGHVLLGFAVEADGAITHTHIARGSGYAILDESALAALQQVQTLPHVTHWLNGGRVELKLPVEYRLTGG